MNTLYLITTRDYSRVEYTQDGRLHKRSFWGAGHEDAARKACHAVRSEMPFTNCDKAS